MARFAWYKDEERENMDEGRGDARVGVSMRYFQIHMQSQGIDE